MAKQMCNASESIGYDANLRAATMTVYSVDARKLLELCMKAILASLLPPRTPVPQSLKLSVNEFILILTASIVMIPLKMCHILIRW